MSEYHHELSAYIACGDTQRIVDSLVAICARADMRRIAPIALPALHGAPSQNNYWAVAILPGAPGWHVLLTLPWSILCEPVSGGGPSRFVALCNELRAPGMLREVHGGIGGYAYGTVTLEADGKGNEAISGSISRYQKAEQPDEMSTWHGYKIAEADSAVERARLIEPLMPTDWTLDAEAIRCNVEEAHLCGEYAQRLGGQTGKWWRPEAAWVRLEAAIELGGPLPISGAVLLTFEWPAKDRPIPQPSRHAQALEAFNKEPRSFYGDGEKICAGDRVELQDGLRATVQGLLTRNDAQGLPEPGGALIETLGGATWMVGLKDLRFLARPDPFRPTVDWQTLEHQAEQGDLAAQYALGMTYAMGSGVRRNHFKAAQWFRRAAERGHREAQYQFAERLLHGNGVLADRDEARKWFIDAGSQGHVGAQLRLVRLYENEFVYPQDPAEAAKWLTKAAQTGEESAQYSLAWKYEHGKGLAQDYRQAALWYRNSAEQGHTGAQVNLGNLYKKGRGVLQDYQQAHEWYGRAAARENRVAQFNLGLLYRDGLGVATDRARAIALLRKSADNGFGEAKTALLALEEAASTQQAMRIDVDIRACIASLSAGEYAELQIPPPGWLSNDAFVRAFNAYPTLLQAGKVVWAHIIQANTQLFEPGAVNCPAEVVYDPQGVLLPLDLAPVAQKLAALRAQLPTLDKNAPAERALWEIANYLEAETTRVFGLEVPPQLSDRGLRISSIYIHRLHLPGGFLKLSYFPILISEQCFGSVMVVPSRWWPPELYAAWRPEKPMTERTSDVRYVKPQDYTPKFQQYSSAAAQGQAEGQFNLGALYAGGEGVERDDTKAADWYRKAALQGHAKAQSALGVMYENGRGVAQDYRQAADWYGKAALQGDAGGQSGLGYLYETGHGVAPDREHAKELYGKAARQAYGIVLTWYRKAALQGHAVAQLRLARFYDYGEGVAQDDKAAFEWYFTAATQGLAEAQYHVGDHYHHGRGVRQDHAQAWQWWHKAALQGLAVAQSNLGILYETGQGVERSCAQAVQWYRKAADQGHAVAQLNLSVKYFTGVGIAKDEKSAYFWCLLSSAQGNKNALKNRNIIDKKLSAAQRAEIQAAARAWKPGSPLPSRP